MEAARVEPVPVHFITGDGTRLPRIPAVNPLPCPGFESPGVYWSPLESPPVVETFGRRDDPQSQAARAARRRSDNAGLVLVDSGWIEFRGVPVQASGLKVVPGVEQGG